MKQQLLETYTNISTYLSTKLKLTPENILDQTKAFNNRYMNSPYGEFLQGMAEGANLTLSTCQVLNAMETFMTMPSTLKLLSDLGLMKNRRHQRRQTCLAGYEITDALGYCTFAFVPPANSSTNSALIGRTYDYPPPFNEIAQGLTLTFLFPVDSIPTAIISMPGQIYCPTCVTATGNFIELNAGMPSGGWETLYNPSLLIGLLTTAQNLSFQTFDQLSEGFLNLPIDYSLIVNMANKTTARSFEYATNVTLGGPTAHSCTAPNNAPFASTNFFQCPAWKNLPLPTDACTWKGVTRHNNAVSYFEKNTTSPAALLTFMNTSLAQDGVVWWNNTEGGTIYQVAYDTALNTLYLMITENSDPQWEKFSLSNYFCAGGYKPSCTSDSPSPSQILQSSIVVGCITLILAFLF